MSTPSESFSMPSGLESDVILKSEQSACLDCYGCGVNIKRPENIAKYTCMF